MLYYWLLDKISFRLAISAHTFGIMLISLVAGLLNISFRDILKLGIILP